MSGTRLGGIFGFLGVVLGAFGAHALKDVLDAHALDVWRTAVTYHLVHALLLVAIGDRSPWATRAAAAGIVLFSGSLYALALTGIAALGAITPIGGVAFLAAWALVIRVIPRQPPNL